MCQSIMIVTEEKTAIENEKSKEIHVLFYSSHVEHSDNFQRCHLTDEDRAAIAGKLKDGVSMDIILDKIRDNVTNLYDPKTLLTKNDLWNIKRDFGIHEALEGRQHESDYVSLILWMKKMEISDDNPVLFFKNQTEEDNSFILIIGTKFQLEMLQRLGQNKICIDSTHGTTGYDLYLTTLVVVDEFNSGFPGEYCLSSCKDTATWKTFFEIVKTKTGIINANVFMIADDPSYYNAWCTTMSPAEYKLICSWHVDQNWRKNIHTKIKGNQQKKAMVYKALKVVQFETSAVEFEMLMSGVLEEFEADEDTREFGEYFKSYYAARPKTWAYCHRIGCGINTNMYLESLHKNFKYFYLKAKKNKRIDRCIDALLKLTRNKMFDRLVKSVKCKGTGKEKRIQNNHMKSKEIIDIVQISDGVWELPSSKNTEIRYEVLEINKECSQTCSEMCVSCNTCIHTYCCNCPDFVIHLDVCKHIHAVCRSLQPVDSLQTFEISQQVNENDLDLLKNAILKRDDTSDKKFECLKRKAEAAVGFLSTCSYSVEEIRLLHKSFDKILQILQIDNGKRKCLGDIGNNEPSNKKITPQLCFVSTKKHRKKKVDAEKFMYARY